MLNSELRTSHIMTYESGHVPPLNGHIVEPQPVSSVLERLLLAALSPKLVACVL